VPYGYYYAGGLLLGAAIATYLLGWPYALPFYVLAAFCLNFFRDPERPVPPGPVAVSPADGKIVAIRPSASGATRISIFLNIFDVHVNRTPIPGKVTCVSYKKGQFLPANKSEASDANEQSTITVDGVVGGVVEPRRRDVATVGQPVEVGPDRANSALHRLNRTEYANAIHDLLALDIDVKALLPADASSEGFDNIAEALATSPSLVQGYVSAAMKISRRAVGDRTATPAQITYSPPGALAQDRHIDGLPLGTRGGMLITHTFPLDAEYELSIGGAGGRGGAAGGPLLDVTLDGAKITVENPRSFRIKVTAGPHTIGAALVDRQRAAGVDDQFSDFRIDSVFTPVGGVGTIAITGPFNATGAEDTPSRRRSPTP